jgi:aryl-alcohol dehydrogenase-like predicted oxidoreductase
MGLLRAEGPPDWHPTSAGLRAAAIEASKKSETEFGQKLADVALKFSLGFSGTTCVGCSTLEELETSIAVWKMTEDQKGGKKVDEEDEKTFTALRAIFGREGIDTIWAVPPSGWARKVAA